MNRFLISLSVLAIITTVLLAGCLGSAGPGTGELVMKITDAPPNENVSAIYVTISQIEIHRAETETEQEQNQSTGNTTNMTCNEACQVQGFGTGTCRNAAIGSNITICGENETNIGNSFSINSSIIGCPAGVTPPAGANFACCCDPSTAPQESVAGWFVFSDEEQTFDLLQLQGVTDILGNMTLEVGKYTQIRLKVESVIVVDSGEEMDATVPSGKIKIIKPFYIEENQTTTLVLDFEASRFVVKTGSGNYKVKPSQIKVSEE